MASLYDEFTKALPSGDVDAMFGWLDLADGHPQVQELKRRMLALAPVRAGDRVLDVGCGLGHEARRAAAIVGAKGGVVGIDVNPAMIAEARRRTAELDLSVAYEVGDAHHLPFPDDSFDLCRTERVLRYLAQPEAALREMARVTRPGGVVVAFDFDSDQTDAPNAALARRIAAILEAAVPHPWIGRQLFGIFKRMGLTELHIVPHVMFVVGAEGLTPYRRLTEGTIDRAVETGQISASEVAEWWEMLERAAGDGTFFSANLGFIVAGTKNS